MVDHPIRHPATTATARVAANMALTTSKEHRLPEVSITKTQTGMCQPLLFFLAHLGDISLALHQSGPNLHLTHGSCPP